MHFDEIKRYLPQYLSSGSQQNLFEELKNFPRNIDQRIYTSFPTHDNAIYQGDGINNMPIINLPSPEIQSLSVMILSNTCDIDPRNKRLVKIRMVYAPILRFESYRRMLLVHAKACISKIYDHLTSLKKQHISNIFYLPKGQGLGYDGIAFLDRLNNCPAEGISEEDIRAKRLFKLSNYGFYLFLVKISIHFTRIREGVDRLS